jgi:hypothetical protein
MNASAILSGFIIIAVTPHRVKWGQIIGFDPADQTYDTAILNGGREPFNDDRMPYPYSGYWLFMRENGTIAAITP